MRGWRAGAGNPRALDSTDGRTSVALGELVAKPRGTADPVRGLVDPSRVPAVRIGVEARGTVRCQSGEESRTTNAPRVRPSSLWPATMWVLAYP